MGIVCFLVRQQNWFPPPPEFCSEEAATGLRYSVVVSEKLKNVCVRGKESPPEKVEIVLCTS